MASLMGCVLYGKISNLEGVDWMIDSEGTQKPGALFSQQRLLKVQTSSEMGISLLANIIYLGGDTTSNLPLDD